MINGTIVKTAPVYSNGSTSYDSSTKKITKGPYTVYSGGVVTSVSIKNGSSVNTPGFRRLKRHQLPNNPHSRGLAEVRYDQMALSMFRLESNGSWAQDTYYGPSKHFGANAEQQIEPDDPYNLAVSRLFSDLSLTKGSLAVTMAEASKTADHIAATATRLYKAYRGLRRGRFDEFTNSLGISVSQKELKRVDGRMRKHFRTDGNYRNFAASTWLEYSYGWKPLINDVYTQAQNLANYLTERSNVIRVGRGSATTRADKVSVASTGSLGYPGKVTTETRATRRCIVVVRYKLDGQPSALDTFGITNPALVAWELVPFSFVVDWFLPVGNFLESLTATNGLIFQGGTVSTKTTYNISSRCEADGKTSPSFPKVTWSGGGGSSQVKSVKNRSILVSFPPIPLPSLKDPRSFAHLASSLSLLQVIFGRR